MIPSEKYRQLNHTTCGGPLQKSTGSSTILLVGVPFRKVQAAQPYYLWGSPSEKYRLLEREGRQERKEGKGKSGKDRWNLKTLESHER
jgi:hypothetical protein